MGQPYLDQDSFHWRNDNGGEISATYIGNPDDDLTSPTLDSPYRLRFLILNTGEKAKTGGYRLEYNVSGAGWNPVTTSSSYVRSVGSANTTWTLTDEDNTTPQLGEGVFGGGKWDDTGTTSSFSLSQDQETELEFCFQFRSADLSGGEVIELRVAEDGGAALDNYTVTPSTAMPAGVFQQSHFRVRTGDVYGLNVNDGWEAALDTDATIDAGTIFRIRFEIEEITTPGKTATLKFQWRKGVGSWADMTYQPYDGTPDATAVPGSHITDSAQYADDDATTNILSGSAKTFTAGTGEEDNTLNSITMNNQHTEYEVALVIHTFFDGPGQNDDGDTFQFRMVESDGTLLGGSYVTPTITLNIPDGYIGGCMVESPRRIGPFCDTNGNLYTVIEASHVDPGGNFFLMIKSTDGGKQYSEMDGANRPSTQDLEAVDIDKYGDTLHIIHQRSTDNSVVYHRFRMSDHGSNPDTWEITDESIAAAPGGGNQGVSIAKRDDGTIVAFYNGNDGTDNRVYYKIRSYPGGVWGSQNNLDDTATTAFWFPACVKGASNRIHVFYQEVDTFVTYHKSLSSGDSLGSRDTVETDPDYSGGTNGWQSQSNPVYYDSSGDEKIMVGIVDFTGNDLYSYVVTNDGTPESRKAVSDGPNLNGYAEGGFVHPMELVVDGTTVYAIWTNINHDVKLDTAVDDGGWNTDVQIEAVDADTWMRAALFTHSAGNGGAKVIGRIHDFSTSGTGFIWYKEYVVEEGTQEDSITADSTILATQSGSFTVDATIKKTIQQNPWGQPGSATSVVSHSADQKRAWQFNSISTISARWMYCHFDSDFASGEKARLGIYDDSSNTPNNLVEDTAEITGDGVAGWKKVQLSAIVNGLTGIKWLAVITDSACGIGIGPGSGYRAYNNDTYSDGFADPFGGATINDSIMPGQIYAAEYDTVIFVDAAIKKTLAGSFTADADIIVGIVEDSITADSTIYATTQASITADAAIQRTESGSFTADAAIERTESGSFTADAIKLRIESDSLTADATVYATVPQSIAADATIYTTISASFTADATIYSTQPASITADAAILKTQAASVTADAAILRTESGSITADAAIQRTEAGSITADAIVEVTQADSVTADATIYATTEQSITADADITVGIVEDSITADAAIQSTQSDTFTADAIVQRTESGSVTADAIILVVVSDSITADATVLATKAGSVTADAYIVILQSDSITADAVILVTQAGSITADAIILTTEEASITADAVVETIVSDSITADAVILAVQSGSISADAYIVILQSDSITADAAILVTQAGSITADAVIKATKSGSITSDATIYITQSASVTADAVILSTQEDSITADATVYATTEGSVTADAYIAGAVEDSITADATIKSEQTDSITADAAILITVSDTFTADALIYGTIEDSIAADATIKSTQQASITADAAIQRTEAASITADAAVQRTESASVTADATVYATQSASITADAIIYATTEQSIAADATILITQADSITADSAVQSGQEDSITTDADIVCVGRPTWVSPPNATGMSETPVLVFTIPWAAVNIHFHLQLDTADTFDTGSLREHRTYESQTNWEYWDGDSWEPFPATGVPNTMAGNNCRLTIVSSLAEDTWYRRVRGGIA